jgi:hypothetical protein
MNRRSYFATLIEKNLEEISPRTARAENFYALPREARQSKS